MPTADNFQLHIYAALAEQERHFISLRTKSALAMAKERGVKLELLNAPSQAFVDGEMIKGIKEHLFSVLRDIIFIHRCGQ